MRLLFFNPENDLALAANDAHYTPPASARQMAADLAWLPELWAHEGDEILGVEGVKEFKEFKEVKGVKGVKEVRGGEGLTVLPWGWSPLAVEQLRRAGVAEASLPSREQIAEYRQAASRQTAVRLLKRLRVFDSAWAESEVQADEAVRKYGPSMLKAPWSGSGRGIHPVRNGTLTAKDREWVRRTLRTQGGVEVEPLYDRVLDCALEFWAEEGRVSYEGLSVFATTDGGVYDGNIVATEQQKMRRLAAYIDEAAVAEARATLTRELGNAVIPAWYRGPVGVDMMVVRTGEGGCALHPLVEINLRMTMGWVALQLARRYTDGRERRFHIGLENGRYFARVSELCCEDGHT